MYPTVQLWVYHFTSFITSGLFSDDSAFTSPRMSKQIIKYVMISFIVENISFEISENIFDKLPENFHKFFDVFLKISRLLGESLYHFIHTEKMGFLKNKY